MENMNAIAEIDKAGRLVIPKKLRDELRLAPGTRLVLHTQGESLLVEPESPPRGLYLKRGTLVYDSGPGAPSDAAESVRQDRESRMTTLLGRHKQR